MHLIGTRRPALPLYGHHDGASLHAGAEPGGRLTTGGGAGRQDRPVLPEGAAEY